MVLMFAPCVHRRGCPRASWGPDDGCPSLEACKASRAQCSGFASGSEAWSPPPSTSRTYTASDDGEQDRWGAIEPSRRRTCADRTVGPTSLQRPYLLTATYLRGAA